MFFALAQWAQALGAVVALEATKKYLKNSVNTHKQIFKNLSKNAFFKNTNFVARLFLETIFERASQKEKK